MIAVEGGVGTYEKQNEYSVKLYTNMLRLIEWTPQIGRCGENETKHFDFYNTCQNCTLLITAITFSIDRDVDLFVNFGSSKGLPTKDRADFWSETWISETLEISSKDEYFVQNQITSMKGLYLISVYSEWGATF